MLANNSFSVEWEECAGGFHRAFPQAGYSTVRDGEANRLIDRHHNNALFNPPQWRKGGKENVNAWGTELAKLLESQHKAGKSFSAVYTINTFAEKDAPELSYAADYRRSVTSLKKFTRSAIKVSNVYYRQFETSPARYPAARRTGKQITKQ